MFVLAALMNLFFQTALANPAEEFLLLKDRRAELTQALPAYTPEERQIVADQALILIRDFYVHLELKKTAFRQNPVPALVEVQKKAKSMTDVELHSKLTQIFTTQRDLHTTYYTPKPFACYRTLIPFEFKRVTDSFTGKEVVAISSMAYNDFYSQNIPHFDEIQVGDVVETYDGMPVQEAIKTVAELNYGANPAAQVRAGLDILTIRFHNSWVPAPTNDYVQLRLRQKSGRVLDLSVPWISRAMQKCLFPEQGKETQGGHRNAKAINRNRHELNELFKKPKKLSVWDLVTPSSDQDLSDLIETNEPTIKYKIIHNKNGAFGYLTLTSFDPEKLSYAQSTALIRDLLTGPFANTQGLLVDLRNNPGGEIPYAEGLIELFGPKNVMPEGFRLKANQANLDFVTLTPEYQEYVPLLTRAIKDRKDMTNTAEITPKVVVNSKGQFYFKPVIVMVNSNCYSSCDIFSAGMQDNGMATIWGEDTRTGAGGANVQSHADLYKALPEDQKAPFAPLPGNQEIEIAWRQAVRVGKNAGKLLENEGVLVDWYSIPSAADLESNERYLVEQLTGALLNLGKGKNSSVNLGDSARRDFVIGSRMNFPGAFAGTTSVKFRYEKRQIGSFLFNANGDIPVNVNLSLPKGGEKSLKPMGAIEVAGFKGTDQVWRKVFDYRFVPANSALLPLNFDFAQNTPTDPFYFYSNGDLKNGWQVHDGVLRVGAGPEYPHLSHAEAALFLDLQGHDFALVQFDAEIHSEEGFDFFKVLVISDSKETTVIAPLSGDHGKKTYSVDLSSYRGKKIELRFVFDSDEAVSLSGPTISRLTID